MYQKIIILLSLVFISIIFSNNRKQNIPFSFNSNVTSKIKALVMPELDIQILINEDKNADDNIPLRFGYKFDVDYNMDNAGHWEEFNDGSRLWRLEINSKSAYGMKLFFNKMWLPEGSKLFIYNDEKDMVLGPYTYNDIYDKNNFGHKLVKGENIIVEYFESSEVLEAPFISISSVIHAYRDIHNFSNQSRDRDCGDNVACSSAND